MSHLFNCCLNYLKSNRETTYRKKLTGVPNYFIDVLDRHLSDRITLSDVRKGVYIHPHKFS